MHPTTDRVTPGPNRGRTTSTTGAPVVPATHRHAKEDPATSHYHHRHRTENTVDHAEAFQAMGGAPSDNKQRGYSHYSAECSASNNNARQRNTVADSRNELFDASTERDDASRRGEDEDEARHRI